MQLNCIVKNYLDDKQLKYKCIIKIKLEGTELSDAYIKYKCTKKLISTYMRINRLIRRETDPFKSARKTMLGKWVKYLNQNQVKPS